VEGGGIKVRRTRRSDIRRTRGADEGEIVLEEDLDLGVGVVTDQEDLGLETCLRESVACSVDGVGQFSRDGPAQSPVD